MPKIFIKNVIYMAIIVLSSFIFFGFSKNKMPTFENESKTEEIRKKLVCDTLILRDICDYCLGENSHYYPHKFSPTTTCICYSDSSIDFINSFIDLHKKEIKIIIIENPSNVLNDLNFKKMTKIETFFYVWK